MMDYQDFIKNLNKFCTLASFSNIEDICMKNINKTLSMADIIGSVICVRAGTGFHFAHVKWLRLAGVSKIGCTVTDADEFWVLFPFTIGSFAFIRVQSFCNSGFEGSFCFESL